MKSTEGRRALIGTHKAPQGILDTSSPDGLECRLNMNAKEWPQVVVADSLLLWGAGSEAIAGTHYGKEHARRKMKYLEIIADI